MQIFVSIGTAGASPQVGEISPLCDFFRLSCPVLYCPYLFSRSCAKVERLDRFLRFMAQTTCFRARKCLLGVKTMGDHIWGGGTGDKPPLPPPQKKWAGIGLPNDVVLRKDVPLGVSKTKCYILTPFPPKTEILGQFLTGLNNSDAHL